MAACYRKDEAADAEIYMDAIAAVLACYPDRVIEKVTDPRYGLPCKCQWLPTVKEVKDACESEMESERAEVRSQRMAADAEAQIAARRAWEASRAKPRPTVEEMKAKYGPNWGLNSEDTEAARERRQKHLDSIAKANRVIFERECEAAGIDPARGVSPSLIKLMQEKRASDAA